MSGQPIISEYLTFSDKVELGDLPSAGLATKLGEMFPAAIGPNSGKFPDFCIKLRAEPAFAARTFLRDALPPRERIFLLVDQLEEIFTREGVTDEERNRFAEVLEALARSGFVWILATMRSDFSHRCQSVPALLRLRKGRAQVDLVPPTPDALARVIEDPVRLSGLHYERDDKGVALSDRLLRDATEHRELLPFLSHILTMLVKERTPEGRLTFASYRRQIGGEGGDFRTALANYAEDVVKSMPPASQAKLESLWLRLITLGGDDGMQPLRQYPAKDSLTIDPASRQLVEGLIEARLLTADKDKGEGKKGTVTIVHETLFRSWDRAAKWIEKNRDMLRVRSSIERSMAEWERSHPKAVKKRDKSLLLPLGLPLRQAKDLLKKHGAVPIDHVRDYIRRSKARARRIRLMQLWFIPAAVLVWLGYLGWLKMAENDITKRGEASVAELSDRARVPTPMPQVDPKRETTEHPRFINGVGMEMIWCGPGEFVMGGTIYNDEYQHRVKLTQGFWLARHELTQEAWTSVMGENPSSGKEGDPFPVTDVSWEDCTRFVVRLTETERQSGRLADHWEYALPTEAQWEYVCRAGTTTEYSFGDALNGIQANCNGKQPHGTFLPGLYLNKLTVVGSYPANPWGFHDMHGNVSEWCFDAYEKDITGRTLDPRVDSAEQGAQRVCPRRLRGRPGGRLPVRLPQPHRSVRCPRLAWLAPRTGPLPGQPGQPPVGGKQARHPAKARRRKAGPGEGRMPRQGQALRGGAGALARDGSR